MTEVVDHQDINSFTGGETRSQGSRHFTSVTRIGGVYRRHHYFIKIDPGIVSRVLYNSRGGPTKWSVQFTIREIHLSRVN